MTTEEITQRLTPIFRQVFEDETLILTDDLSAESVDKWSSLTFMLLIEEVEKQFGIKFKIFDLILIKNAGALIQAIAKRV